MSASPQSQDLREVTSGVGQELAGVDIAGGIVRHLQNRTRQYEALDSVDLFGVTPEARETRAIKPGDHPMVQVLKRAASDYTDAWMLRRDMLHKSSMTGLSREEERALPKEQFMSRLMKQVVEVATEVSKMADGHFNREVKMWMEHAKMVQAKDLDLEEAAKMLAKQTGVPYDVALHQVQAAMEPQDAA